MNIRKDVELILGRNLTSDEVSRYKFYWKVVFMNPHDLAKIIKADNIVN